MLDDTTPDFNLPFEVEIDALGYGVGAKSDSTTTQNAIGLLAWFYWSKG